MTRCTALVFGSLLLASPGHSQVGTAYCSATPNSTGSPSVIAGAGSSSLLLNSLSLEVDFLPFGAFGYFLASFDQGFAANPGGSSGNLCLGGAVGRYVESVVGVGANGRVSQAIDLRAIPQPGGVAAVEVGETLYFQLWHRDSAPGGATSNFSPGLRVEVDCESGLLFSSGLAHVNRPGRDVAAGDFNGDGLDDLVVVAGATIQGATVLLASGGGDFVPDIDYQTPVTQSHVATADMDQDGHLDFVTADFLGAVHVFRGLGNGAFSAPQQLGGFVPAESLALSDLNGDGRPDVIVGGDFASSSLSVALSSGALGYGPRVEIPLAARNTCLISDVDALDVDGDGDMDLVGIRRGLPGSIALLVNDGTGGFSGAQVFGADFPRYFAAADFNGDGLADLALENSFQRSVALMLNDGSGGFLAPVPYTAITGSAVVEEVVSADFNGDGRADVAVGTNQSHAAFLLNDGSQGLLPPTYSVSGVVVPQVAVGDFNGDGTPDLAGVSLVSANAAIHINAQEGRFESTRIEIDGVLERMVAVDLDGDGREEVVVTQGASNRLLVLGREGGSEDFVELSSRSTGQRPVFLATGDFNQDLVPDVAVAARDEDRVWVHFGTGGQGLGMRSPFPVGDVPVGLAVGDLNGDGRDDIVTANANSSGVSILLGDGAGGFQVATIQVATVSPFTVALGDLDSDGDLDLTIGALLFSGDVEVLMNDGSAQFTSAAAIVTTENGVRDLAINDLNGDGALDVAFVSTSRPFHVALGDGQGGFMAPARYLLPTAGMQMDAGDLDGDGDIDLAFACEDRMVAALNRGDGMFLDPKSYAGGGSPQDAVLGDIDGDGSLELLATTGALSTSFVVWLRSVCR